MPETRLRHARFGLLCVLFVLGAGTRLLADESQSVFLIGNSLTWDTVPPKLGSNIQWHVDCGKSLPYIVEHPETPCVKSSTLWPEALKSGQYNYLVMQLHYGSNLEQDLKALNKLIALQPNAQVVIHTGWARSLTRADEWDTKQEAILPGDEMRHSKQYFKSVIESLRKAHPDRVFTRTYAIDALEQIASDCEASESPFKSVEDLYRDKIHMNLVTGRYLMHNLMRRAIGRPSSSVGFEELSKSERDYLDKVIDNLPGK